MSYVLNLSAPMGFSLQPLSVKKQWEAVQRRTSVTPFLGKGARGIVVALDKECFQL